MRFVLLQSDFVVLFLKSADNVVVHAVKRCKQNCRNLKNGKYKLDYAIGGRERGSHVGVERRAARSPENYNEYEHYDGGYYLRDPEHSFLFRVVFAAFCLIRDIGGN